MAYSTLQGIYNNSRTEKAVIEKKEDKKNRVVTEVFTDKISYCKWSGLCLSF